MTLDECRQAKQIAQSDIAKILKRFTKDTGCVVQQIDLNFYSPRCFGAYQSQGGAYAVNFEVNL